MSLAAIASLSFLVALSGAMAPGPLLSYTIARTAQGGRRAMLVGVQVVAGHALLEAALVLALLLGLAAVLRNEFTVRLIGVFGGAFLAVMGASLLRQLLGEGRRALARVADRGTRPPLQEGAELSEMPAIRPVNPILAGALVSMSNPYWWVWWASVGFAFMVQYNISLARWPALLAFFVGHEAGDLAWYATVSILVSLGRAQLRGLLYQAVLVLCALIIIGFGLFLGVSSFLYRAA